MSDDNIRRVWTEDELDAALEVLNADVRTDEQVLSRARAALMITTESGENEVTTTEERTTAEPAIGERRPRRSGRRWLATAAGVGVLVAGALIAQTVSFGGRAPATAEAVQTLDRAAAQTIGAVDEPVGPGQYRYIAMRTWGLETHDMGDKVFANLAENLIETWVPANEQDEWMLRRDTTDNNQWVIGTEEEAKAAGAEAGFASVEGEWRAKCGDFHSDVKCQTEGNWQNPTAAWQASLPTDPDALFERLNADAPDNDRGGLELLVYAADALCSSLITKDVRANIYKALEKIPGLQVTEKQANLGGRIGIALGVDDGDVRQDIIIDPATGQFIGQRQVTTDDVNGFKAGTVTSLSSVTTHVVDAMGVKPTG
ncbi:hypothetical protein ALI22I_18220 [Saccharothrix sp. ALI-22-I]|uniref:CU044_5270 family protein n=1 Tax=Saccharothrix sp. ALI-22-I TaxID=1933778 RepID=UPI00097C78EC|nr:CU044_5270 family protein [Saccharothrix sp. ALI-22-I]ONI88894.1 hypothetical protein ALI22I_18220 [Saccharothrix sp. ALI-22-I]